MEKSNSFLVAAFLLFSNSLPSLASPPNAVVAPVYLDTTKYLYTVSLGSGRDYLLDLGGHSVWSVCRKHRTHVTFPCKSQQCSLAAASSNSGDVSCRGHTCNIRIQNPITGRRAWSELTYTESAFKATNGSRAGKSLTFHNVMSSCAPPHLLMGLPAGSIGCLGLGGSNLDLEFQLTSLAKRFAFCLPLNDSKPGMIFFGGGPYYILPPGLVEATEYQASAPMVRNPARPDDLFLPVKELEIVGYDLGKVSNTSVKGWSRISTQVPYTTLSTPLYKAMLKAFDNITRKIPPAPLVKPFGRCLNVSAFPRGTPPSLWDFLYIGPVVNLKMDGGDVWEFLNADNMKQVSQDVLCLAYLDGGPKPEDDIVIGLYQMKERLMLFDFEAKKIGISATNINYIHAYCGDFLARA
ncbi:Basic 7S globulin 2 [Nymphaea thermarum]|nr:Basic 7S globulin 2 [Nymphaea thermarum]